MDTQKLIARLRERAATQDACGCWSLDRAVANEMERLADIARAARLVVEEEYNGGGISNETLKRLDRALDGLV